jgi:hypothetical protein
MLVQRGIHGTDGWKLAKPTLQVNAGNRERKHAGVPSRRDKMESQTLRPASKAIAQRKNDSMLRPNIT